MNVQTNGSIQPPVQDGVIEGVKYSGWLFRFVPGGWFRKRWAKKWGVLIDERIYLYDSQFINNNDKKRSSHVINLLQCERCGEPPEPKVRKKNPHSFEVELKGAPQGPAPQKKGGKVSQKPLRELFDTESAEERDCWLRKIREAILRAKQATHSQLLPGDIGFETNIDGHVTEDATEQTKPAVKKGSAPPTALKPPKVKVTAQSSDEGEEAKPGEASLQNGPAEEKPVPTPRRRTLTLEETDGVKAPIPPPTPSKALKPKLVRSNNDVSKDDVTCPADNAQSDASSPTLPHVLPLKFPGLRPTAAPRTTRSLDRKDLFEQARARSASSSSANKPAGNVGLVKTQALKLPGFPETDSSLVNKRGKSRSMTLLDRFDDLPPPPIPPPAESVSDIEVSSENVRIGKKRVRKKRTPSNPNTTDEDE